MPLRLLFGCVLLSAACGKVSDDKADAMSFDHRGDGGDDAVTDAGAPDAAPVSCEGPEDCMNPDDPCLLAGPCEDNVCKFAAVECGHLDGECAVGVCQGGECVAQHIREAEACGDGIMDCTAFDTCGGFADDCDESGTQSRSCTDSTCQAGECVTGAVYADSRTCPRETDGDTCAASTTSCTSCQFSSTCDRDAPPRQCTRTDHTCSNQVCGTSMVSLPDQDVCHRDTECLNCTQTDGDTGQCTPGGLCGNICF